MKTCNLPTKLIYFRSAASVKMTALVLMWPTMAERLLFWRRIARLLLILACGQQSGWRMRGALPGFNERWLDLAVEDCIFSVVSPMCFFYPCFFLIKWFDLQTYKPEDTSRIQVNDTFSHVTYFRCIITSLYEKQWNQFWTIIALPMHKVTQFPPELCNWRAYTEFKVSWTI